MLNGAGAEGLGRMAALGGHETPLAESLREINPSASFVRICQNLSEFRAAGALGRSRSLDRLLAGASVPYGIKLTGGNVGVAGKKVTLPHYMSMFL